MVEASGEHDRSREREILGDRVHLQTARVVSRVRVWVRVWVWVWVWVRGEGVGEGVDVGER